MIIRGLDSNQDFVFGINQNAYKITQEAIMQNISTKLREWVGDCFFNNNAGVDWLNRLGFSQQTQLEAEIQSLILQCYGVVNLIQLTTSLTGRDFSVTYTIQTIYSQSAQGTTTNQS